MVAAVLCLLAAQAPVKDLVLEEVRSVLPGTTSLAVSPFPAYKGKETIFVGVGKEILYAKKREIFRSFARLPSRVRFLRFFRHRTARTLVVLTERGRAYFVSPSGRTKVILTAAPGRWIHLALSSYGRYCDSALGVVEETEGRLFVEKLKFDFTGGGGVFLKPERRLARIAFEPVGFTAYDFPGREKFAALSPKGKLWRIGISGTVKCILTSSMLSGSTVFDSEDLGVLGGGFLAGKKGEVWLIPEKRRPERLVALFDEKKGEEGEKIVGLSKGPRGDIYILTETKIFRLGPPAGSDLERSVEIFNRAEDAFEERNFPEAAQLARDAAELAKRPTAWRARLRELAFSAEGMEKLTILDDKLRNAAYAGGLKKALALFRKYGKSRARAEIVVLVKRCELADGIVTVDDFEESTVFDRRLGPAKFKPVNSAVTRTTAPEPVKEGEWSLKWELPAAGKSGLLRSLEIKADFGRADQYTRLTFWLYSRTDYYPLELRVVNADGELLSLYSINARRKWIKFSEVPFRPGTVGSRRSPYDRRMNLFMGKLELWAESTLKNRKVKRKNVIYIDDIKLYRKMQRR